MGTVEFADQRSADVAETLRRLGLYYFSESVAAGRKTPEEGVEHIDNTIERGRRTKDWNAEAVVALNWLRSRRS